MEVAEGARRGLVHATDDVEQRGLAAAGLAEQDQELALVDVEVDATQDLGDGVAVLELSRDVAQLHDGGAMLPCLEARLVVSHRLGDEHAHDLDDVGILLGEAIASGLVDDLDDAIVVKSAREGRADGGPHVDAGEVRLGARVGRRLEPEGAHRTLPLEGPSDRAFAHRMAHGREVVRSHPKLGMEALVTLFVVVPDDDVLGAKAFLNDPQAPLERIVKRLRLRDRLVDLSDCPKRHH